VAPALGQLPAPPVSVARRCPDISKARRVLDYAPTVNLEQGLQATFAWYKAAYHADGTESR
jgi:UDP-glucuronate decarboxylase